VGSLQYGSYIKTGAYSILNKRCFQVNKHSETYVFLKRFYDGVNCMVWCSSDVIDWNNIFHSGWCYCTNK